MLATDDEDAILLEADDASLPIGPEVDELEMGDLADAEFGNDMEISDDEGTDLSGGIAPDGDLEAIGSVDELETIGSDDDLDAIGSEDGLAMSELENDENFDAELSDDHTDVAASLEFGGSGKAVKKQAGATSQVPTGAEIEVIGEDSIAGIEAEEVSEEAEMEFEKKFDEDMLDTENIVATTDTNSGERSEAIRLVEEPQGATEDNSDELLLDDTDTLDDVAGDELGFEEESATAPLRSAPAAMSNSRGKSDGGAWSLTGIRNDGSAVVLEFSSGATVHLHPNTVGAIGRREISVGGQRVAIGNDGQTITIEADGVSFMLPRQVA
jgi:hypothetical protein